MKKVSLFIYCLLIFKSSMVYSSDELTGYFECKVKGINIIGIEEGKHKEFSGYKNAVKKGDNVKIYYISDIHHILRIKSEADLIPIHVSFSNAKTKGPITPYDTRVSFMKKDESCKKKDWTCQLEDMTYLNSNNGLARVSLNDDWIYATSLDQTFTLERYYKNDWNGIFSKFNSVNLTSYNITFDCRHSKDKLNDFLDKMKNIINKLNG